MFKYEYVQDEPKRDYRLLVEGKCNFEVLECKSTKKTGEGYSANVKGIRHPALMIKFMITDKMGTKEYVYDLIFHWKLKALLNSANSLNLYNKSGMMNESNLLHLKGICEIIHEDQGPPHGIKNKIDKYCWPENGNQLNKQQEEMQAQSSSELDDDIPF